MRISDWSSDVCSSDLGEEWGGRYIIRPGPDPGTLSKDFSRGVHHFRGTIAPDGSVLWIRKGMIKSPHRISLVDGELREESGLELQGDQVVAAKHRSEEHTSELQSLMRNSYAVFCLKNNTHKQPLTS